MGTLLLFNVTDPEKRAALRLLSLRLGLHCRDVQPEEQSMTVRELLVSAPAEERKTSPISGFREEMLLMSGLSSS